MTSPSSYIPIFIMLFIAFGFVVTTMIASHWLGPKRKSRIKNENFECGIQSQGNARLPFSIKYFLVAILFVIFDIEVIFMYPWAVNFHNLGIIGIIEVFTFIGLLFVGFIYLIKRKGLEWAD